MAIVFDCPHCGTNYRLKDEVGGKTATCKNPNCRKVIPIPMPTSNGKPAPTAAPADLDAFAAAAFADEPAKKAAEAMIPVTCTRCDHVWQVEASKEGKNVLCPECRTPTRVPLQKKTEKADWRTGAGPTLAKRETGLDREGAFGTGHMGGISDQTAREIVKGREAEEEPEERRKKWLKRAAIAIPVLLVLGAGGYFLMKERRQARVEGKMEEAIAQVKEGTKDPRYLALIARAAGEHKIRSSGGDKDTKAALTDLQLARTTSNKVSPNATTDKNGILALVAVTMADLIGSPEQVQKGERLAATDVIKEIRQTLQSGVEPEVCADVLRALVRKGHTDLAEDVARQMTPPGEMLAQVGLELIRINAEGNRKEAEAVLAKASGTDPSVQALRMALGKQPATPAPKGPKGGDPTPSAALAEAAALAGDVARARSAAGIGRVEDKARAFAAAAQAIIDSNTTEGGALAELAATNAKAANISPWLAVRICRLLARAGKFDPAESLASSLTDEQAKAWARLEILRARLATVPNGKADDGWLTPLGDPNKLAAAARAHEEVARHNARAGVGDEYQATVNQWPGIARSFGTAGLLLGQQDPK
jgi:predicted negative regulator of RcsB-dependent stress response